MSDQEQEQPLFSVVRGEPDDAELAALVAVFSCWPSGAQPHAAGPSESGWSAYWRAVGAPLRPGPESWRASGRIR